VVPAGNLVALTQTARGGNRARVTREVGVVMHANERTPGACRPGASTDTYSLHVKMVDDDGDVILDETRSDLVCDRRVRREEFQATYDVVNCAGSVSPSPTSAGDVTVTATTESGELVATRNIRCTR
jgi:hypothetical protein